MTTEPFIVAASSRADGNMAFHTLPAGDAGEEVATNREVWLSRLDLDPGRLVVCEQVHGIRVREVTGEHAGRGASSAADALPATDGLLTREPGLPLMMLGADCPLVCLFDPDGPAVAVVHAGWRGLAAGVLELALDRMAPRDARTVRAYLAPLAGPCCYEVGEEVAARFPEQAVLRRPDRPRPHLDLKTAAELALGLPLTLLGPPCTICTDSHFSHRRNAATHRHALVAALRDAAGDAEPQAPRIP